MGKRELKRLESKFERQETYNKRSKGLLKKAYEIAALCDIEAALIMYSPTEALRHFSTAPNVETILQRFVQHLPSIPEKERQKFQVSEETINRINFAADQQGMLSPDVAEGEENDEEIRDPRNKLMLLQEQERMLYPGMGTLNSMPAFEERKKCLETYLDKIIEREQQLLMLKKQQEVAEALNWGLRQRGGQQVQQLGVLVDGMGNPSPLNQSSSSVQPAVPGSYGNSDFQLQLPTQQLCEGTSDNTQVIQREQLLMRKKQQEVAEALNWGLRQRGGQQVQQLGVLVDGMGNPSSFNPSSSSAQPLLNASPPLPNTVFTEKQDDVFQTARPKLMNPVVAGSYGTPEFQKQQPMEHLWEQSSGNTQVPLHLGDRMHELMLKQQQEVAEALNWGLRQRGGQQVQQLGVLVDGMGNPVSLNPTSSSVQPAVAGSYGNSDFQQQLPMQQLCERTSDNTQVPQHLGDQIHEIQHGMAASDSAQTTNSLPPFVTGDQSGDQCVDDDFWDKLEPL